MLAGLGLGTSLVARDEQEGGVHDGRSIEHGGHENVVAGAIDETHVPPQLVRNAVFLERIGVGASLGAVRGLAFRGQALVDLGVGVSQLDGNVALQFVLETDRLHAADGLDDGGLSVGHMADRSHVDGGLARDLDDRRRSVS